MQNTFRCYQIFLGEQSVSEYILSSALILSPVAKFQTLGESGKFTEFHWVFAICCAKANQGL